MKFQQEENKVIVTSCKNCAFAVYEEKTQVGCVGNRIEKFKLLPEEQLVVEAYDNEKEFFVINRFCNLYRDKEAWADKTIDQANEEIKVSFNIMINCDNIDTEYVDWIESFLKHCKAYGEQKSSFSIYHNNLVNKENKQIILKALKQITNYNLNIYFDKDILEHNIINKSTKTYSIIIEKNRLVDVDILEKINSLINVNLQKALVIKNNNSYIFSNLAYKIENIENPDKSINDTISSIVEKSKPQYYFTI